MRPIIELISSQLSSFTCFLELPVELQDEIWTWAAHVPRNLDIWVAKLDEEYYGTRSPSILSTVKKSREIGQRYYKLRFGIFVNLTSDRLCFMDNMWGWSAFSSERECNSHTRLKIALDASAFSRWEGWHYYFLTQIYQDIILYSCNEKPWAGSINIDFVPCHDLGEIELADFEKAKDRILLNRATTCQCNKPRNPPNIEIASMRWQAVPGVTFDLTSRG